MSRRRRFAVIAMLTVVLATVAGVGLALGVSDPAQGTDESNPIPTARSFSGVPEIGALYASASAARHGCTASVVDSPAGDTLITAAHCVSGTGAGMVFVPEGRGTRAPLGRWTVRSAYIDERWRVREDPHADIAFLTVAPQEINGVSTPIEKVTGAYALGSTPTAGERVTVSGYPAGHDDDPITCTIRVYVSDGYPTFDCHGYVNGTSGSPWVLTRGGVSTIVGVIGGLHQGGCHEYTSYSSPIDTTAHGTYTRAATGTTGDEVPPAGRDGC